MAAVWMRFRAELRGRWRALRVVALLVGLAGGARRTDTAFDRLLADTDAADILVNPDNGTDGVAAYDFARLRIRDGRMPRKDRPNEILINEFSAKRLGLSLGDRFPMVGFSYADLEALERGAATPLYLALILTILAPATVAHALVSAVRQRRRDPAMLTTHGLTRRQISSTVAWQVSTTGAIGLMIGGVLVLVIGKLVWRTVADDLGVSPALTTPVVVMFLVVPLTLLLVNVIAAIPARAAARTRPAVVLRSE